MVQAQVIAYNKIDAEGRTFTVYAEIVDGVIKVTPEAFDSLMTEAGWEKR